MKRMIDKLLGWLKDSNRPKHILCGLLVYDAMMALCLPIGVDPVPSSVISLTATLITAAAVDYKDKLWGGKFDWLDVAATVLLPTLVMITTIILVTFLKNGRL